MIHARPDYNRFQDPAIDDPSLLGEGSTPIRVDEPVMLFDSGQCLICDAPAIVYFSPDLDIQGLPSCHSCRDRVKILYLLTLTQGQRTREFERLLRVFQRDAKKVNGIVTELSGNPG